MRVSRQLLEVGMELAADVLDHQGRKLLPAGTVLTPREISALELWSIAAIDVIEARTDGCADLPLSMPVSAGEEERVRSRFRHLPLTHPVEQTLLAQSLLRAARRAGGAGRSGV